MRDRPDVLSMSVRGFAVVMIAALLILAGSPAPAATASLRGSVSDAHGAALGGVLVEAFRFDAAGERVREAKAWTSPTGSFSFERLAGGRYFLRYSDPDGDYETTYSGDGDRPASPSAPGTLDVPAAAAVAQTLRGLSTSTQVAGYVLRRMPDGQSGPLPAEVFVRAFTAGSASPEPVATGLTYGGEFELAVPPGDYRLEVDGVERSGEDDLAPTTVAVRVVAGRRNVLEPLVLDVAGHAGELRGRAEYVGGRPLVEATATLLEPAGGGWTPVRDAQTDELGQYVFTDLEEGGRYSVQVTTVDGTQTLWLGDVDRGSLAQSVRAVAGPRQVPTITFGRTTDVATVTGFVRVPPGASPEDTMVSLYRWDGADFVFWSLGYPQRSGAYFLKTRTPGLYTVRVEDLRSAPRPLASRWLGTGADRPEGRSGAPGTVDLTGGASAYDRDISVPFEGALLGTVRDSAGMLRGGAVEVYRWSDRDQRFRWVASDRIGSGDGGDQPGSYAVALDGPGTYAAFVDADDTPGPGGSQWLAGVEAPSGPSSGGTFVMGVDGAALRRDITLSDAVRAGGRVSVGGAPVVGASVATLAAIDGKVEAVGQVFTDEDGRWQTKVRPGRRTSFRATAGGLLPRLTDGDHEIPSALHDANSLVLSSSRNDIDLTMEPAPSDLGRVAGQRLPFCWSNSFRPGAGASRVVDFTSRFGGVLRDEVVVTGDGAVGFGALPRAGRHVDVVRSPTAVIAPFLARSRRAPGSWVTYGVSRDGRQLCVVWHASVSRDARADNAGDNTFQLLLTRVDDQPGRQPFDIAARFNYDRVRWGRQVFGAPDAALATGVSAGYSAGEEAPSVARWLAGSGVADAFVEQAPRSLVGESSGARPGRRDYSLLAEAPLATRRPVISGASTVGSVLVADAGRWSSPDLDLTSRWFRDGRDTGATGRSYVTTAADAGSALTVEVVARRPGAEPGQASSEPMRVDRLASRTTATTRKPVLRRAQRAVVRLSVTAAGLRPSGRSSIEVDGSVRKVVETVDGAGVARLPRLRPGRHRVVVRYVGSDQVSASVSAPLWIRVRR